MIVMRCLAALLAVAPLDAAAQAVPGPAQPAGITAMPVGDDALRDLRGKYVTPRAAPAAATLPGALPAGGQVVYFGIAMQTTWHVDVPQGPAYVAEARLTIDLRGRSPVVSVQQATAMSGTVSAPVAAAGAIAGSIADGRIAGIAQAVQIAGSRNAAANAASVTIGESQFAPVFVVAPSTPNCGVCATIVNPSAFGTAIALPGRGIASQTIGAAGVAQQMQIVSNSNAVRNSLAIQIGMQPVAAAIRGGFGLFALPSVPGH